MERRTREVIVWVSIVVVCVVVGVVESQSKLSLRLTNNVETHHTFTVDVYYPAIKSNTVAPLLVFSHCYVGAETWYDYFWKGLTAQGYIVAMVGGYDYNPFSSSPEEAYDQSFVLQYLLTQSTQNPHFALYHKINVHQTGAVGHSNGGAASILSGNQVRNLNHPTSHYNFTSIMPLSGCPNHNKTVAHALTNNRLPSLYFTASRDCMCIPSQTSLPYYHQTSSTCKYYININGGTHCHFAQAPELMEASCTALEDTYGCGFAKISKAVQYSFVVKYATLWFNYSFNPNPTTHNALIRALQSDSSHSFLSFLSSGC